MSKELSKTYICKFDKVYKGKGYAMTGRLNNVVVEIEAGSFREARNIIRERYPMAKNIVVDEKKW